MDYVISFGDVMAGVITVGFGILTFFIRSWFNGVNASTDDLKKMVKDNGDAISRRIDKLEEKHGTAIGELREELTGVEKDFPHVYVLREDFLRSMNSVENKINSVENKIGSVDGKIDRILVQMQKQ